MEKTSVTLRVFFDEPFWVGITERISEEGLAVCRTVFGAEPEDGEVYAWILGFYDRMSFSPAIAADVRDRQLHFKKRVREVRRQIQKAGVGNRSQQALSLQRELMKTERSSISRLQKEAQKQERFEQKQQKKKEKHRGR